MNGHQFKAIMVRRFGTFGWRKKTAELLGRDPSTIHRIALSIKVPDYAREAAENVKEGKV